MLKAVIQFEKLWTAYVSAEALALATMGIKVLASEKESLRLKAPNGTTGVATPIQNLFAPSWVWVVRALRTGVATAEIKRAVHSRTHRARIEALLRLQNGTSKVT